jgi:hypothetical protein
VELCEAKQVRNNAVPIKTERFQDVRSNEKATSRIATRRQLIIGFDCSRKA